jgi:cytoskeletal protein RodZ
MKDLAELLKTERLNRNVTLETLSERSGISLSMLTSLEACDCERFGSSLLIRNAVRAYCQALQIESEPLLQEFSSQIEACNIQEAGLKRYGRQMKILRKKRRMIGLPLFVVILISAAVFYGGTWISERRSKLYAPPDTDRILTQEELPAELQGKPVPGPDAKVEKPGADLREADEAIRNAEVHIRESEMAAEKADSEGEQSSVVGWLGGDIGKQAENPLKKPGEEQQKALEHDNGPPEHLSFSNSTDAVADDKPVQDVEKSFRNKFAVEADDKVWIQVRIDDKKTLSEMLHAGDRREWAADKSLQVVIGNAGGVRMKWNEHQLAAPRDPGRVLRFRLPDYAKTE